ncbi:MAG: hypothetical protein GY822_13510 [Deltaproteobacteria bacterium]|nr:hypothetical protein [Deltaproteobacteria bacterium]
MLVVFLLMVGVAGLMFMLLTEKKALGFALGVVGFGGVSLVWKAVEAAALKAGNKYVFIEYVYDCICRLVALA